MGWKGSCNPADANVFSGTFDGKGHVISELDIRLEGSIEGEKYGQVGLFSIIGSDRADDFAEVKNLIFSNVSVSVDFSNELAAVGTLAGEVNGYARVSNVVVVSGKITVNPSKSCDTVGAGGIVGECRSGKPQCSSAGYGFGLLLFGYGRHKPDGRRKGAIREGNV